MTTVRVKLKPLPGRAGDTWDVYTFDASTGAIAFYPLSLLPNPHEAPGEAYSRYEPSDGSVTDVPNPSAQKPSLNLHSLYALYGARMTEYAGLVRTLKSGEARTRVCNALGDIVWKLREQRLLGRA